MMQLVIRRGFSSLPTVTKIKETQPSSRSEVSVKFVKTMNNIIQRNRNESWIIRQEYHRSLGLNFAEAEDGRIPILRVEYFRGRLWELASAHTIASFSLFALIPLMPSIYYAAGTAAYLGYSLYSQLPHLFEKYLPKITSIDLLEDGKLEIVVEGINGHKILTVQKEDFIYGSGFKDSSKSWKHNIVNSGAIWCSVEGRQYLIGGNKQINEHLIREIF